MTLILDNVYTHDNQTNLIHCVNSHYRIGLIMRCYICFWAHARSREFGPSLTYVTVTPVTKVDGRDLIKILQSKFSSAGHLIIMNRPPRYRNVILS